MGTILPGITTPIARVTNAIPLTGNTNIDALLERCKWGGAVGAGVTVPYSFPYTTSSTAVWDSNYSVDNEPAYTPSGLNLTEQQAATGALQQWVDVSGINFLKVADTATSAGDIRFAFTSAPDMANFWGWSTPPNIYNPAGGDIWINPENSSDIWLVGRYNFMALMHEVGHAIGLKHPFEDGVTLPIGFDSNQYSVMSYTEHPHSLYLHVTNSGNSYSGDYRYIYPRTPMLYDIAAAQYLYGVNNVYNSSDTTYTFDPTDPFFMTIWDAGGNDTISVANFSEGCIINLQDGQFSKITIESDPIPAGASGWQLPTYDGTDNLAIAFGVTIEQAIGGSGNDQLIGNSIGNRLTGGAGNDTLIGGGGVDTAVYTANRAGFTFSKTSTGWTVTGGTEGNDTLSAIERLQFADTKIALDLGITEAAGQAAQILGAAFGTAALANTGIMGVALGLFDSGMTFDEVCRLAVGTHLFQSLAGSSSNADVVGFVYSNVVGTAPAPAARDELVSYLQGSGGTYTQAEFLAWAATTELNNQHVNLVGLQNSGIAYT